MKIGGADYSIAELPGGVLDTMQCARCQQPMTHIGKGYYVCFEDRMIGTAIDGSVPTQEVFIGEMAVPAVKPSVPHFMQKLHVRDEPSLPPLSFDRPQDVEPILSDDAALDWGCTSATHQWSKPSVRVVTIEETSVRCGACGTVLRTEKQGTVNEVMAELLKQIPQ